MRMRTEMRPRSDGGWMAWCDPDKPVFEHFNHDAMAAHAIKQAMHEAYEAAKDKPSTKQQIWITQYQTLRDIRDRADALLREWTKQDEWSRDGSLS